jgi:hypothetical protein
MKLGLRRPYLTLQKENIISSFRLDITTLRRVEELHIVTLASGSPLLAADSDRTEPRRHLDNIQIYNDSALCRLGSLSIPDGTSGNQGAEKSGNFSSQRRASLAHISRYASATHQQHLPWLANLISIVGP